MIRLLAIYKAGLALAVGLTVIYAFQGCYPEFMSFFSNAFPPFIAGAAVGASTLALRRYGHGVRERFPLVWLCFTLGMTLWFMGETSWAVYTLLFGVELPYPSIADVFWLGGYIPLFIALYLYVKTFGSVLSRRTIGIAMLVTFILSVLVSTTLITPVVGADEDLVTALVDFAYPLLDLVLFSVAVLGLTVFLKGSLGKSWLLISAGILSFTGADMLFSYTTAQGVYYTGHLLELLFHFGDLLFILAFYVHVKEL